MRLVGKSHVSTSCSPNYLYCSYWWGQTASNCHQPPSMPLSSLSVSIPPKHSASYAISPYGRFEVNRKPHISLTCASTTIRFTFRVVLPRVFLASVRFSGRGNHLLSAPMEPRAGFEPASCFPCFMVRTAVLPLFISKTTIKLPRHIASLPDRCTV